MPEPEPKDENLDLLMYIATRKEPFATATDIEPRTEVGYKQTRNRLDDLVDEGLLNVKKVGNVKVYWLSEAGRAALSDADFSG